MILCLYSFSYWSRS